MSFLSRFEGIYISEYYFICRIVNITLRLRLKFRVTSLTINSHRGRHSQVLWQPCVKIEKRYKGWNSTRTFVLSVTTFEWTCPRGSSRGYVRGNTRRWTSTAAFGYNFRADTSCNISKRVRVFHHRLQTPRKYCFEGFGLSDEARSTSFWYGFWNETIGNYAAICFCKRNNKKLCNVKYFPFSKRTRLQSWFISIQPRVRKERHGVGAKYGLWRRELSQDSRISRQQGMKQIRVNLFNE